MAFSSDQPLQTNQLPISVDLPQDQEQLRTVLTDNYKKTANIMNTKEGSLYLFQEIASYKQLSGASPMDPNINCYRTTFDLVSLNGGNITAGATVAFPHGITGLFRSILVYVSASSTAPEYFTVVYPDCWMDGTNINFTNISASDVDNAIFVAEYAKN